MSLSNLLATKYKISRELASRLSQLAEAKVYEKETRIIEEGAKVENLILPLSGVFGVHQHNPQNSLRHYLGLFTAGTVINDASFVLGNKAEFSIVTLTDGSAIVLDLAIARQLYQSDLEFAQMIARSTSTRATIASNILSYRNEPDQTKRVLLALRAANKLTDGNTLPLSNEQLALLMGMSRNTIGTAIRELVEQGVIDHERGKITLLKS